MKIGIRIVSCVMLLCMALTMAVFSLADFSAADTGYTLDEHAGMLAVYTGDGEQLVVLTDIELASLRSADREMINRGLQAASREEIMALLEDLGS